MEPFDLSGIVLAAGRSTRMGQRNKLLLPWGNKRLVQRVVEILLTAPLREILVVVGHEGSRIEELLSSYPVRVVHNSEYAAGLSTSVRKGVEAAAGGTAGYLFALGDMPRVRPDTVSRLCATFFQRGPAAIVVPLIAGRRGNPVVFGRSYREELLTLQGDRGARPLLQRHAAAVAEVRVEDAGALVDIDTPEAYCEARQGV